MRSITQVIDQVLELSEHEELNQELKKIRYDAGFRAPELMYTLWDRFSYFLQLYIPIPETGEEIKILSIFSTLSEEEIREEAIKLKEKRTS